MSAALPRASCSPRFSRPAACPISGLQIPVVPGASRLTGSIQPEKPRQARENPLARLSLKPSQEKGTPFRTGSDRNVPSGGLRVMKHKNSHLLVGYWGRLRKGRAVPDQTDIDPRAIKRMLSQI